MKLPPLKPLIITSLPVFASVFIAATLVWRFGTPKLAMPFVLGIIAGGLVDLDNRLTGRLKNIIITVALFTLSSLVAQSTLGTGLPFILAMTLMTFGFTILGAVGLKYRTFAFGALAVATYTTLTYTPETFWLTNPVMILLGTVLYSTCTLVFQIILPHRPVQESVANAYEALGGYFDAKADFFDPDEAAWLGNRQIDLAMSNTGVITAFNQCRAALFYRLRGKHRHPRTAKMLRYYFTAQDIHERVSSAHADYTELTDTLKNTDLIFRIRRLLEMQGQACRNVAAALRNGKDYTYSKTPRTRDGRLPPITLALHRRPPRKPQHPPHPPPARQPRQRRPPTAPTPTQRLPRRKRQQQRHPHRRPRKQQPENVWQTVRSQLNFESGVFRHATRLSILVAASCIIVEILHLNLGYWILLTAVFVCQPNYTATKSRVYQRIAGTILGVIVGSLVPYFTPSVETKLWIVIASTTLFFMDPKLQIQLLHLLHHHPSPHQLLSRRAGRLCRHARPHHRHHRRLRPRVGSRHLPLAGLALPHPRKTAAQTVGGNGAYLRKILDQLQYGIADDVEYRTVRRQAHERTATLSSTLSDMSSEPKKYGNNLQSGFNLLKTSYALTGYISALGAYRSEMDGACSPDFVRKFYQSGYRIADLLERLPQTSEQDFQTTLSQIRTDLEALQTEAGDERQSHILHRQLTLIANQLNPCYRSLHDIEASLQAV